MGVVDVSVVEIARPDQVLILGADLLPAVARVADYGARRVRLTDRTNHIAQDFPFFPQENWVLSL
jgi:hypothetical protein